MTSNNIVHVNDQNYQLEVISYSRNTPVIVEFWANWSRECRTMSPLLERLVSEAQGSFRLAKVDVDENPNLTMYYNVRSVPALKAISHGNVVQEYTGMVPEHRLRDMVQKLTTLNTENLLLERADNLLLDHQWVDAEDAFRQFLQNDPNQPAALLGLTKTLIPQGKYQAAQLILKDFPISRESSQAELLSNYLKIMVQYLEDRLPVASELDSTFKAALRLAHLGNFHAALDGILDILKIERNYRNNKARMVFLAILELLGPESPEMRAYRQELAAILF